MYANKSMRWAKLKKPKKKIIIPWSCILYPHYHLCSTEDTWLQTVKTCQNQYPRRRKKNLRLKTQIEGGGLFYWFFFQSRCIPTCRERETKPCVETFSRGMRSFFFLGFRKEERAFGRALLIARTNGAHLEISEYRRLRILSPTRAVSKMWHSILGPQNGNSNQFHLLLKYEIPF